MARPPLIKEALSLDTHEHRLKPFPERLESAHLLLNHLEQYLQEKDNPGLPSHEAIYVLRVAVESSGLDESVKGRTLSLAELNNSRHPEWESDYIKEIRFYESKLAGGSLVVSELGKMEVKGGNLK